MRDVKVMILDEPIAALDARAELEVFHRFKELSDGKMEASGTHEQLLAAGGRHADLFELQTAGYR